MSNESEVPTKIIIPMIHDKFIVVPSVGTIGFYKVSIKKSLTVTEKIHKPIEEISPVVFFEIFASVILFKKDGKSRLALTVEEIKSISEEERELVIRNLIELDLSLTRSSDTVSVKKGDTVHISSSYSKEPVVTQAIDESLTEYFKRTYIEMQKRQNLKLDQALKNVKDNFNFSSGLNSKLANMFADNDYFKKINTGIQIKGLDSFKDVIEKENNRNKKLMESINSSWLKERNTVALPKTDWAKEFVIPQDPKIKILQTLVSKNDKMHDIMEKTHLTMSEMLNEIMGSSRDNKEVVRLNIRYSRVNVGIAFVGLIITVISLWVAIRTVDSPKVLVPHLISLQESLNNTNAINQQTLISIQESVEQNRKILLLIESNKKTKK